MRFHEFHSLRFNFDAHQFHSIPFHSIPFNSIQFHSIPFNLMLSLPFLPGTAEGPRVTTIGGLNPKGFQDSASVPEQTLGASLPEQALGAHSLPLRLSRLNSIPFHPGPVYPLSIPFHLALGSISSMNFDPTGGNPMPFHSETLNRNPNCLTLNSTPPSP